MIDMKEFDKLPLKPDWTLRLSERFLMCVNPRVLQDVKRNVEASHVFVSWYYNPIKRVAVYTGFYGPDRKAGAMAIAPLIEELDAWRRGYKDSDGRLFNRPRYFRRS